MACLAARWVLWSFWGYWVPWGTQLFLWKINTNFKIKSAAKPECHQNQNFHQAAQCTIVLLMWVKQVYCQYTTERFPVAELHHTVHPGGVRQHRAGHHNLAHCSLLEATGCHASSCSMHHLHASVSCINDHHESCQESQVFCVCLLFWDPNPISNR